MRLSLLLPLMIACAEGTDPSAAPAALPDEALPPPTWTANLSASPVYPGQPTTFSVTGIPAGSLVYILKSEAGPGAGPCHPAYPTMCAHVRAPFSVVATAAADPRGTATAFWTVPGGAIAPQWFQAAVVHSPSSSARTSQVLVRVPNDTDGDFILDAYDNCELPNPLQADADNDTHGPPCDCDDADPTRYPGAPEVMGDGIDQDCDGEDLLPDRDGTYHGMFHAEISFIFGIIDYCDEPMTLTVDSGATPQITGTVTCNTGFVGPLEIGIEGTSYGDTAEGQLIGDGYAPWYATYSLTSPYRIDADFSGDLYGWGIEGTFDAQR